MFTLGGPAARLAAAIAILLSAPTALRAGTIYGVNFRNSQCVGGGNGLVSDSPLGLLVCHSVDPGSVLRELDGSASAGANLGASTGVTVTVQDPFVTQAGANGSAEASVTGLEVVFSGSGSIETALNLHLHGIFDVNGDNIAGTLGSSLNYASAQINIDLSQNFCGYDPEMGPVCGTYTRSLAGEYWVRQEVFNYPSLSFSGSGLMTHFVPGFADQIGIPQIYVSDGDVLTIDLRLFTQASCVASADSFCNASANFANTFGFALDGPVFDLPDGWTANSRDGSIVNNRFVPEPATAFLLTIGLGGIAASRPHRKRKDGSMF